MKPSVPDAGTGAGSAGSGDSYRIRPQEVARSPQFRRGLAELAAASGSEPAALRREALAYLHELRTAHSPRIHRWIVKAGRALCGAAYARIDYDAAQVETVRAALARHPAAVLASHRSYLDGGALTVGFHDHGLPSLTVFAGGNLAFWPIGTIWRRADGVFIRRGGTSPVYRFVLREYLGYLVEQGRPLQWFLEGTRSRTGKLGQPRLGLLIYLVHAYLEGRTGDLLLLPVSISYDQLREVTEYAGEARGARKRAEGLGWLLRFVRGQRGRLGTIYVRFGEPVSLAAILGPGRGGSGSAEEALTRLETQRLALEVAWRINAVTPITGAALVTLGLLAARDRALTLPQLRVALHGYLEYARQRHLPLVGSAALDTEADIAQVLEALRRQGIVIAHSAGAVPVFALAPDAHLGAAYYRNSIVHHFLLAALAELALLGAAEAPQGERLAAFPRQALELRELLQFDFFFRERREFLASLEAEIGLLAADWKERLAGGPDGAAALLSNLPVLGSDMLLRSFIESYAIVADALCAARPGNRAQFEQACHALGRQYLLQRRVKNPESLSSHLFRSALELARHRGLTGEGEDLAARRAQFAAQLWRLTRHMSTVNHIAVRRVEQALARAAPTPQR